MQNLRGIALMIFAMACFALGDVGVKSLAPTMPLSQIVALMGGIGTLVFAIIVVSSRQSLFTNAYFHPAIGMRFAAEIIAALFMSNALAYSPLSLVTSVTQAGPIVVALGAVVFFRESVGWRRWSAIIVGLVGVLIIIRPGAAGFNWFALLSVGAMLGLAARDLCTRAAPAILSNVQLATIGMFGIAVAGVALVPFYGSWIWPNLPQLGWLSLTTFPTIAGYYAITAAMRIGEISIVTPFRYSRLIFGLGFGILLFGEEPDMWVYMGSALVVGSGIYTVLRERRLQRRNRS